VSCGSLSVCLDHGKYCRRNESVQYVGQSFSTRFMGQLWLQPVAWPASGHFDINSWRCPAELPFGQTTDLTIARTVCQTWFESTLWADRERRAGTWKNIHLPSCCRNTYRNWKGYIIMFRTCLCSCLCHWFSSDFNFLNIHFAIYFYFAAHLALGGEAVGHVVYIDVRTLLDWKPNWDIAACTSVAHAAALKLRINFWYMLTNLSWKGL